MCICQLHASNICILGIHVHMDKGFSHRLFLSWKLLQIFLPLKIIFSCNICLLLLLHAETGSLGLRTANLNERVVQPSWYPMCQTRDKIGCCATAHHKCYTFGILLPQIQAVVTVGPYLNETSLS